MIPGFLFSREILVLFDISAVLRRARAAKHSPYPYTFSKTGVFISFGLGSHKDI